MHMSPESIRRIICGVRRVRPNTDNWSESNIWNEVQDLVCGSKWYEFYDFIEACAQPTRQDVHLLQFEPEMNRLFDEEHIGWRLKNGVLEMHGEDVLEDVTRTTEEELKVSGFQVAAKAFRDARSDLSRRPEPDLSGAIHHAMEALESVAREFSGDPKRTLGEIIKKYPTLLPSPVKDAATKLWGFASDQGRHGKESRQLEWAETLFVVGVAGALCSYLNAKRVDRV